LSLPEYSREKGEREGREKKGPKSSLKRGIVILSIEEKYIYSLRYRGGGIASGGREMSRPRRGRGSSIPNGSLSYTLLE